MWRGGKEAAEKRAKYPHDDVAEESQPVTECNATGQETRHQPDQAPNQDRGPVHVDRGPVDCYSHSLKRPALIPE
jgi:hypothetical protein